MGRIDYDYSKPGHIRRSTHNILSATEWPEVVRDYLSKECSEEKVLGPLDTPQLPGVHTSRFSVIPKGSTGKGRLTVDKSSTEEASTNDGINKWLGSPNYVGVNDTRKA